MLVDPVCVRLVPWLHAKVRRFDERNVNISLLVLLIPFVSGGVGMWLIAGNINSTLLVYVSDLVDYLLL